MITQNEIIVPEGALEHGVLDEGAGSSRLVTALLIAAISASALSLVFSLGTAVLSAGGDDQAKQSSSSSQHQSTEPKLGSVGTAPLRVLRGQPVAFTVALTHTLDANNPAPFG